MLLDGKRLLITGVLTDDSIAYAVAERAQPPGPRWFSRASGAACGSPSAWRGDCREPPTCSSSTSMRRTTSRRWPPRSSERWGALDGVLHAIAFAPPEALGGASSTTPAQRAEEAFRTSAFSLKHLAVGLLRAARGARRRRDRRPGLRRYARLAVV